MTSREKENQTLTSRLAESQDAVSQLKQLVENHVASEREKNKRVRTIVSVGPNLNYCGHVQRSCLYPSDRRSVPGGGEAEGCLEQPVAALLLLWLSLQETAAEPTGGGDAATDQTTAVPARCKMSDAECLTVALTVKKHEKVLLVCIQQMFLCAGVKEAAP